MNNKLPALSLIFLGLFLSSLFLRRGDILWLAFPFLIYIAIGLTRFPARDKIQLRAERRITRTNISGQPCIEVEVIAHNLGGSLPSLQLLDNRPPGVKIIDGNTELVTTLARGGEASLKYSFLERRGRFAWKSVRVRTGDPLRLMHSEFSVAANGEMLIHPERENYLRLPVSPRYTLHAPGSIPAHRAGSGTDFWGVRPYHPGDPLRWLDWRLNARYPGQFFTREFEQDEAADIGLILDARSETDQNVGGETLFDYSVRASASLAEAFIHQGNRVSLLALGKTVMRVFPGYGKYQLNRIFYSLSGIRSSSMGRAIGLHYLPLAMFSNRAMLVVLSPLTRVDTLFFNRLRAAGRQALLISPDPYDFLRLTLSKNPDTQRAYFLASLERRIQLQSIERLNIKVIDWQVSQPLFPLIRSSLGHLRGHGETRAYYGA